jgi:hypothetical protein
MSYTDTLYDIEDFALGAPKTGVIDSSSTFAASSVASRVFREHARQNVNPICDGANKADETRDSWRCACSRGQCQTIGAPGKQHASDEQTAKRHASTGRPLWNEHPKPLNRHSQTTGRSVILVKEYCRLKQREEQSDIC